MGAGKQELVVAEPPKTLIQLNPIVQIQSKFKELEIHLKTWLSKQSLPVEAAVVTAGGAAQGALIGALMGTLTQDMPPSMLPQPAPGLDPKAMASLQQAQVHFFFLHLFLFLTFTICFVRHIFVILCLNCVFFRKFGSQLELLLYNRWILILPRIFCWHLFQGLNFLA